MVKRIFHRETYKTNKKKKMIFLVLKISIVSFLTGVVFLIFLFVYYAKDLPRPEKFTEKDFVESTKIFDRTGKILLYELYGEEKRDIIPLDEMPDYLKKAVISAEDAKFYSHNGIDLSGIFRSIRINLKIGSPTYGGSTISQQLIRSTFLTPEKTIKRKVREIILTLELERRYSKDQILEWYLNQIPFGPNLYGIESASQAYFQKSAKDLSISESAVFVAMIQAPSRLSPYGKNVDDLMERKDYVLDRMAQEGYLTKKEAEDAKIAELKFNEAPQSINAPHFVFYVRDYLLENYGQEFLERGGLKIYTTLDWDLQQIAEKAVLEGVEKNKSSKAYNAALVAINPKTGEILSMVGSADWFGDQYPEDCVSGKDCLFDPKVNIAAYGIGRQPGSSFKPFVYATAFQKGYDDKYIVIDEPTNFGIYGGKAYMPRNYDGLFRGPVTLRQALAQSLNIPSVKVLAYLAGDTPQDSIKNSIETAKKMGITTLNQPASFYGLSIVLGGGEVKLLDMVSAYGVFATDGMRIPPVSILKIEDTNGKIIEESKKTLKRVIDENSARLISDILSDNEARTPMFGSRSSLYFANYQVAVKTGTTNDYKDAWTVGYTPSLSVGVWAGNNDNTSMAKLPGIMISTPIWREFMVEAIVKFPKEYFIKPIYTPIIEDIEPDESDKSGSDSSGSDSDNENNENKNGKNDEINKTNEN
ncbi:MAG: PBP1A family penicillin-binding protein [Candidatus Nealsonbacteria bacterium]